jgi:DNA-directed RNA polymerase specialized sigma24 family protein
MDDADVPGNATKKRKTRYQDELDFAGTSQSKSRKTTPNQVEVKEEPLATRMPLTEDYIREHAHRINPRNGKKNCVKCVVSFYNWMRSQSEFPQAVDVRGPKTHNMISHPKNNDYMIFQEDQKVSINRSGFLQVNLEGTKPSEEFYVDENKPILFKRQSIEEFQTLLSNLLIERTFQIVLVFFADKDSSEGGHHWGFYSYKDAEGKQVDLIVDPQPKPVRIYYTSQLQKLIDDNGYEAEACVWYDAPGFHPGVLERFIKLEAEVINDPQTPEPLSTPSHTLPSPYVATPEPFSSPLGTFPLPNVMIAEVLPEETEEGASGNSSDQSVTEEETQSYETSESNRRSSSRRSKTTRLSQSASKKKGRYESEESLEDDEDSSFHDESDNEKEKATKKKQISTRTTTTTTTKEKPEPNVSKKRKREEGDKRETPSKKRKTPHKVFTDKERKIMVERRRQGDKYRDIAIDMDCDQLTVQRIVKEDAPHLIKKRKTLHKIFTDKERKTIVQRREEGDKFSDIARDMNCHPHTLEYIVKEDAPHLIKKQKTLHRVFTDKERKTIVQRREEGDQFSDIARDMKCHKKTVAKIVKEDAPHLLIKKKLIPEGVKQRVVKLKEEGGDNITNVEIGKQVGLSDVLVGRILKKKAPHLRKKEKLLSS